MECSDMSDKTQYVSDEDFLREYFPTVEHGIEVYGPDVLVQFKLTRKKSHGGIILTAETQDVQKENTVIARIVTMGPLAYCNRETGLPWTEGVWAKAGTVVLVPRWGGFRFPRRFEEEQVVFSLFKDFEVKGGVKWGFDELDRVL
jgi:co-chaperonin GroES (HSP10)